MCTKVFCTIIESFCVAICAADDHTNLITIEQSNSITFSIALRSADRQTEQLANSIAIKCSQHNPDSCT